MSGLAQYQFLFGQFEIRIHHHGGQGPDVGLRLPAQQLAALAGIAFEVIHLGGAEVAGVNLHVLLPLQVKTPEGEVEEVTDANAFASGHHVVVWRVPLEHTPHRLDVVARESPIPPSVEVAQEQLVLQAQLDAGGRAGDLAGDEGLAAAGTLVVEEDAVAGEEAVAFPVVDHLVVGIDLGTGVGAAGLEAGALALAGLGTAEHLGAAGLVEANLLPAVLHVAADGLQQPDDPHAHHVHGVLGLIEAHADMALGAQVVDLVRLDLIQQIAEGPRVGEVTVVEVEAGIGGLPDMQMVDAIRVEQAGTAHDAVDLVPLGQQELGEVASILAGDARNQGRFRHGGSE